MIELWKNEGGRIGEDIHKALLKITGKSFGPRVEYWEHWFNNLEEPVKEGEKEGDYISYHGLETKSKNIAFVIDHSGSMSEKVKAKHGGYVGEGAVVKGDTKMAFVKAELIRVIKSLPKDTRFNIVAFEAKVTVWEKAQTDATKRNKSSAIKWVESLRPSGQTNVYDAIVEAFGRMNPGGKVNTRYKGGPDTIFVLSDGLPNAGTIPNAPEILEAVKEMNKIRQVTIHTIGVGKMTKMFLEPLAKQNNGTFKLVAE
ncbi:MAG: VWA domain-containing protein [Planctomycetota bacterium]|nr:VWA domain-containing protein [Planctomycetota bacterium]